MSSSVHSTIQVYECHTPHLVCRKPEIVLDELTHHDYDYISVFQEANLKSKSTTGNPQPSTAGDGALEVQFKLSPCDAYGPVTGPMDEDMYS